MGVVPRASAEDAACIVLILLGASIPISTAVDNIFLSVYLVLFAILVIGRSSTIRVVLSPVAVCALALFLLLALGTLYGDAFPGDANRYLMKYADLLLVPLMLPVFRSAANRTRALYALAASMSTVLVLSYAIYIGWLEGSARIIGDAGSPVVFKKDMTHNFLMAFAAYLFLQLGLNARATYQKTVLFTASALAAVNVLAMVRGRTGYLVLLALALYSGYASRGWKGFGLVCIGIAAVVTGLLTMDGPFQERFTKTVKEAREWQQGRIPTHESVSLRFEFYRNTLQIVSEHPIVGVGTGGFPRAYQDLVSGTDSRATVNPHNEFLHIAAQLGAIGLAALVWLFYTQWRLASVLPSSLEKRLAHGSVIAFVVGSLFNSLLLDHAEGLLFAWLAAVLFGGYAGRSVVARAQQLEDLQKGSDTRK